VPELRDAEVIIGIPGLNGGGITNSQLLAAIAALAPNNASFITKTPSTGLSAEQALNAIPALPGIAKINADGSISKATGADLPAHAHTGVRYAMSFPLVSSGASVQVPTGEKPEADLPIPVASKIVDYALVGTPITGQSQGSAVVDLWSASHTNYPPDSGESIIGAGAKPTISNNVKNVTGGFTGWTTVDLLESNFLRVNLVSCTNLRIVHLVLFLTRSV
jgi:hypothetical protein